MPINVSLPSKEYQAIEKSTWKDVLVFCLCCLASIYFFAMIFLMLFKRGVRKYAPLRIRNIKKLVAMKVFSLIHLWSAFIASDYFSVCRSIEQSSCVIWNYWLPFSIGLGGWFAIFVLRLFDFISLFKVINTHQRKRYRAILFVLMITPPLVMSMIITISRSSYLSTETTPFCNSTLLPQIAQIGYISIYLVVVFIFIVVIKFVIHRESVFNEYHVLKDIAVSGLQVLAVTAFIQIYDAMQTSWGRFIFGVCLVYIHVYASLKLCGKEVWYALKNDQSYITHFLENETKAAAGLFPYSIIMDVPSIRRDFVHWCNLPGNIPNFFRDVEDNWKTLWSNPRKEPGASLVEFTFKKILNEYLMQNSPKGMPELNRTIFVFWFERVDYKLLDPFTFSKIEQNLLQPFVDKRANEYLKIMENRPFFNIETKRQLAQIQLKYLREQLEAEKLISKQISLPASIKDQFVELLEIF